MEALNFELELARSNLAKFWCHFYFLLLIRSYEVAGKEVQLGVFD